ncbi:MAG: YbaL family putative K(+) efflux transporter [Parvibaculum sp.]|uniref:YbaL family putative K(+) efflux transporter n=1 Tax=Parvibaculum sp. TaxID=2024848 RepID=UPI00284C6A93|nr:YbaL family putative K(+) efflux transporter [Parvibaculum sp.]MDR3498006.1 YbaL family putative K(+) efflux transporter [Parvibaculum sp.]
MDHGTPLIATIVGGLALAFIFGTIAQRLRVSPLVGYLLAGVLAGPFTPGFVADKELTPELAEIGVILLMFGVGLHFSLKDLLAVKAIAIPGAIVQIALATLLGMTLAWALGWSAGAGLVFGLALSVASTVVLLRALQERRLVETVRGHIAVGWLIVEDLAMVLTLVLLPPLAGLFTGGNGAEGTLDTSTVAMALVTTLGKVAAFVALMLIVGRRVVPWILHYIAHTGSRELFRLAVLVIALGVAFGSAILFGVSFALGAFFAGMILSESPLSQRAAEETLPLRDAFAVLFFVSVGMLFNPSILLDDPLAVIATLLIIVVGKSLAAFFIVRAFGHPLSTALTISASLAQIGEFSFILATLGVSLHLLPERGRDLVLAGAILSILLNPLIFILLDRLKPWLERHDGGAEKAATPEPAASLPRTTLTNHAVVVGLGRVGGLVAERLMRAQIPILAIEDSNDLAARLRERGLEVVIGNAARSEVIAATNLAGARWLFVAIPNGFEAGQVVQQARKANPALEIVARAHSDAEVDYLRRHGANVIIMGEREIARGMIEHVLGDDPEMPAPISA